MRTKYALITLLTALPVLAFAQNPPASTNNPAQSPGDAKLQQALPKPVDSDAEFQAIRGLVQPATGQVSRVVLEGALVRATQAGQPWQAINPAAPMEFGDGWDNVSLDPRTRQPSGIVLLSLRFGKSHRK
jgi:hypothetical protein